MWKRFETWCVKGYLKNKSIKEFYALRRPLVCAFLKIALGLGTALVNGTQYHGVAYGRILRFTAPSISMTCSRVLGQSYTVRSAMKLGLFMSVFTRSGKHVPP